MPDPAAEVDALIIEATRSRWFAEVLVAQATRTGHVARIDDESGNGVYFCVGSYERLNVGAHILANLTTWSTWSYEPISVDEAVTMNRVVAADPDVVCDDNEKHRT